MLLLDGGQTVEELLTNKEDVSSRGPLEEVTALVGERDDGAPPVFRRGLPDNQPGCGEAVDELCSPRTG